MNAYVDVKKKEKKRKMLALAQLVTWQFFLLLVKMEKNMQVTQCNHATQLSFLSLTYNIVIIL